jgi:hypothetical protein
LKAVCCRVVDELRGAHPGREIRFTCSSDAVGLWDADRLHQALANLVENALKHGARDEPVEIELVESSQAARLEVRNGGPPIDSALLPRVFEAFQSGGSSTGLGLYIARQLVTAHGGSVAIATSHQHGTRVSVTLPLGRGGLSLA